MQTFRARIAQAIADAESTEPNELGMSLQHHIETDAIQQLVEHGSDSWSLQFDVPGHTVTVTGRNEIYVDGTRPGQIL